MKLQPTDAKWIKCAEMLRIGCTIGEIQSLLQMGFLAIREIREAENIDAQTSGPRARPINRSDGAACDVYPQGCPGCGILWPKNAAGNWISKPNKDGHPLFPVCKKCYPAALYAWRFPRLVQLLVDQYKPFKAHWVATGDAMDEYYDENDPAQTPYQCLNRDPSDLNPSNWKRVEE